MSRNWVRRFDTKHQRTLVLQICLGDARRTGRPWTFGLAGGFVVIWLISGPLFGFSDTWQLVMNTISSVVTFLMVFLIQNTQNRDSAAGED